MAQTQADCWSRFSSQLVKCGRRPDKVFFVLVKELKKFGLKNPRICLPVVISCLGVPIELKRRRRGRKFLQVGFPITKIRQEFKAFKLLLSFVNIKNSDEVVGRELAQAFFITLKNQNILFEKQKFLLESLKQSRP